ncbi:hypothetical protein BS50DRAFT_588282 [Corynespora cassiicola Philippines]|uniref:F-box domain-containing protein n=1 Tax=Corynespora cassiicola Philippines TaxID=1448308 RepID=A0A2T2NPJ3_CORCC|nr:hypothetical protein BS50DRAFT_588282 [Corynespora cassiicola Philippines]
MRLHELPDDVLIPIVSLCDTTTVFDLRITCASFRAVIDTYICTIAPAVARNTFPPSLLALHSPDRSKSCEPSLRWLRGLIPAHLAALTLDKDKLRRYPYITAGFPYGIPYENTCETAIHWRHRISNGWRVLRRFHLVSRDVYGKRLDELYGGRPKAFRRMSSGVKSNRVWQAVSCPYTACTEHGVKGIFEARRKSDSGHESVFEFIEETRQRESIILKRRVELLKTLSDQDLLDYIYLWRLLLWVFRPYRKPGTSVSAAEVAVAKPNWQAVISDMSMGCSWLNWYVLHVGTSPFWTQWALPSSPSSAPSSPHSLRNLIWDAWAARSHHRIEVEREYTSKFEFALRKRCLTPDRLRRLESEVLKGRTVKTISLDCIPWPYDQHCIVNRPSSDFPWYETGQWVWMDRDYWIRTRSGGVWGRSGSFQMSALVSKGKPGPSDGEAVHARGELRDVRYLVYLGLGDADDVWAGTSDADLFLPRY